jgi:hypothetical protein
MQYIKEMTVEIRITKGAGSVYGCDVVNTNGELIFGSDPEFETVKEALAFSLSQPQVGLCGESS